MEIELFPFVYIAIKIDIGYLPAALYFFWRDCQKFNFWGSNSKDLASVAEQGQHVCGNSCLTSKELLFLTLLSSNSALSVTFHKLISHNVYSI